MKKTSFTFYGLGILAVISISFSSCFTLAGTTQIEQKPQWIIGQFTNEWGDDLGIYYTKFTGSCEGIYSNTWDNNQPTKIDGIRFSHQEGLYFETSNAVSFFNEDVNIIIRNSDGTEYNFSGQYINRSSYGRIIIKYSDELLNALSGENIIIRFNTKIYRSQFNFPPRFIAGYEELQLKTAS